MNSSPEDMNKEAEVTENTEAAEAVSDEGETPAAVNPLKFAKDVYDWVEIFVTTICAILIIFSFFVRVAYVDGPSMNNTLMDGETLVVSNLFYTPKHNDLVVFQSPDSGIEGGIIKRVIALEEQVVDIDFDTWTVTVDGKVIDEPYVNFIDGERMRSYDIEFPITVPKNCIFVMGDNRNHSNDIRSSQIGCVDTRFIFGRVLMRLTPIDKLGAVE